MAAQNLRCALFLPQYAVDPATGTIKGHGTGQIGIEIAHALAAQLGGEAQIVGYETPADVADCLQNGGCDMAFMGIVPSRVAQLDFSPAVFQFDFTYLVPGGSPINKAADADRPGVRIAFVAHHAAAMTLQREVKAATLFENELPEAAFEMLCAGAADAMAFPRSVLVELSTRLPGSRVLSDCYGINRVGIAIRKGQAERLAFIRDFVEDAKASGLIEDIIKRGGLLHEYQVSPREARPGR